MGELVITHRDMKLVTMRKLYIFLISSLYGKKNKKKTKKTILLIF